MKRFIPLLAVFGAGIAASFALASPPPGRGHDTSPTTGTSVSAKKVLMCHKTGNGRYVRVWVSIHSAHARGKHKGDIPATGGTCPSTAGASTTGTTEATTTTPNP